jgi:hypothetical protein
LSILRKHIKIRTHVGQYDENVFLLPGITELGWDVIWKDLAKVLNFRSEAALKCAKKVNDHHKGWTMCRIAREALTCELAMPFVRAEMKKSSPDYSPSHFIKFMMNAIDPNYAFMVDFTLELLDAIFLFRAGVRGQKPAYIYAGLAKFAKIWSGRNHPLYREIEMHFSIMLERMPDQVRHFVDGSQSLNMTGVPFTAEGVDFRLEEVNKKVQHWLPKVPSPKDWKVACSNLESLEELRSAIFSQMDIVDPKDNRKRKVQNIADEVKAFRTVIREKEYLSQPHVRRQHISLDGSSELDNDLVNFCELARDRREEYCEVFLHHEASAPNFQATSPPFHHPPVAIHAEERARLSSIENMTAQQMKHAIQQKIESTMDDDLREALFVIWGDMATCKTKAKLIKFYYELQDIQETNPDSPSDDSDDE